MFNSESSESIEKILINTVEHETKLSNLCDLNSHLKESKDNTIENEELNRNLERFYEQKQSKIEELLYKKSKMEFTSISLYKNRKSTSIQKSKPSVLTENNASSEKINQKNKINPLVHNNITITSSQSKMKKEKSISNQREYLNKMSFNDYIEKDCIKIRNKSFYRPKTALSLKKNNEIHKKKELNLKVMDDNIIEISPCSNNSKLNVEFSETKPIIYKNFCKGNIPNTTKNNFFLKKSINNQNTLNNPALLQISLVNQSRSSFKKEMNNIVKDTNTTYINVDKKSVNELSFLNKKHKNIDYDTKSIKTTNPKNYSSILMKTNETEKVSTNLDTQINYNCIHTEDNVKRIKINIDNSFNNEGDFEKDFEALSKNSINSSIHLGKRKDKCNLCNSVDLKLSDNNQTDKLRSDSLGCNKKYSSTMMNKIVERRRQSLQIYKTINKEDFYKKNKEWKEKINSRNLQIKLEKERKEISSLSFKPKISMTSTNLCRKNNLFLINDFYERNTKWKEEASKNLKNQVINYEKVMYDECVFKPKTNIILSNDEVNKLKKDKTFIYKKNVVWLKKVMESRKIADLDNQKKFDEGMLKSNLINKFYRKSTSNTTNNFNIINTKDKTYNNINKLITSSNEILDSPSKGFNFIHEFKELNDVVSRIADFQSGYHVLKFVDREFSELKDNINLLSEIVLENKNFVKHFDQEFTNLAITNSINRRKYKTNANFKMTSNSIGLKRNFSEKLMKSNQTNKVVVSKEKGGLKEEGYFDKYKRIVYKIKSEKKNNNRLNIKTANDEFSNLSNKSFDQKIKGSPSSPIFYVNESQDSGFNSNTQYNKYN